MRGRTHSANRTFACQHVDMKSLYSLSGEIHCPPITHSSAYIDMIGQESLPPNSKKQFHLCAGVMAEKKESFRKYLETSGVIDAVTKVKNLFER